MALSQRAAPAVGSVLRTSMGAGQQWTARSALGRFATKTAACSKLAPPSAGEPPGYPASSLPLAAPPSTFSPRTVYEPSTGVPRAYFLGHHRAALDRMGRVLATVGLVIECRDLRVPLTAWNPLLESSLMGTGVATENESESGAGAGRRSSSGSGGSGGSSSGVHSNELPGLSGTVRRAGRGNPFLPSSDTDRTRIIVYTKRDLVVDNSSNSNSRNSRNNSSGSSSSSLSPTPADLRRLANLHRNDADAVLFLGVDEPSSSATAAGRRETARLVAAVRAAARRHGAQSLTGLRALVVGMPNAGKSTLLNRLRAAGMADASRRSKAAATGAQPGVTRKLGTPVRVLEEEEDDASASASASDTDGGGASGVLVMDTPGVFLPYVADAESMLKLALVGCVREGLVPPVALADYLLFQLNKRDPALYVGAYGLPAPTEDVHALLDAVARRTGKLARGGRPAHEAAAMHLVHAWRRGKLGRFCLDALDAAALASARAAAARGPPLSMNQARKREKERRKARAAARHSGAATAASAAGPDTPTSGSSTSG